ncbi:MAG TPA: alpha/beta hydrolase [Rhizomicrobium sp.]|nr:alpha/beta hydrolase [Rhizomicrobium sp.]
MTKFATAKDGVRLAYETVGSGRPILLVHGFASDRAQNWRNVGWYETLTGAGFAVTAMDCRGHGESGKPHDDAAYGDRMVGDIVTVMDAAGLERPDLMGYSMGGILTVGVLMTNPSRVSRAVCAGIGETYFASKAHRKGIAAALRAPDPSTIIDPTEKAFRAFAGQDGKDLLALAACMSADRTMYSKKELGACTTPVLVIDGDKDTQSGRPEPLADAFANGRAVIVPNRDHMTAVGDKAYKQAVVDFLRA